MRRALLIAVCVAAAALGAAGCGTVRRAERPPPARTEPGAAVDPDAALAEARRTVRARAAQSLLDEARVAEEPAIRAALRAMADAWNRGDLAGFMAGYERSDDVRFASGGEVLRGWNDTFRRYGERYPDRDGMGGLSFSGLDIDILAPDAAVVFGRWRLALDDGPRQGLFTLVMRKTDAGWRVVHDHTSAAE